jgi:hypothetical protein
LITCYSRDDGAVLGVKVDVLGEQAVPLSRRGTEDDYTSLYQLSLLNVWERRVGDAYHRRKLPYAPFASGRAPRSHASRRVVGLAHRRWRKGSMQP